MATGDSSKVIIIEPGMVKTIDGKEYYNDKRIIAGSPEDVEAYHAEGRLGVTFNATPTVVPVEVRSSEYGCRNCLWCSCECDKGSMYKPKSEANAQCDVYTYYD